MDGACYALGFAGAHDAAARLAWLLMHPSSRLHEHLGRHFILPSRVCPLPTRLLAHPLRGKRSSDGSYMCIVMQRAGLFSTMTCGTQQLLFHPRSCLAAICSHLFCFVAHICIVVCPGFAASFLQDLMKGISVSRCIARCSHSVLWTLANLS